MTGAPYGNVLDPQAGAVRPALPVPRGFWFWAGAVPAVATLYFAAARLGLSLAVVAEQVSAVWPPTGIALAAVLLLGYRVWPGIALGAFLANLMANEPIATAGGIAAGNTLEAVIGAWLLHHVVGFDVRLHRVKDALGLIVLAAGLSTMVSATIGVSSLALGGVHLPSLDRTIAWSDFAALWWVWWLGDAIGVLVVCPVLLTWKTHRERWPASRAIEAGVLFVTLIATSWVVFTGKLTTPLAEPSLAVFPFVIWAALRFGPRETSSVTLIAAGLAIWATVREGGPFGGGPLHEQLLLLQLFIGVVAATALLLSAALSERRQAEAEVRASEQRLRLALEELQTLVDMMPVGIFIAHDAGCERITMNPSGAAMLRIPLDVNASKSGPNGVMLPFRVLKNGEEVPPEDLPMQRAARTRVPVVGEELDVVREDGSTVTLYEYASPLYDEEKQVRGCLGVFVDITARRQAEEALREADRRKDEFLATLAHEIRNPLAPIRTGVELMRLIGLRDPQLREVRDMLERQVQQITRLVDDLLDVSRVTRGKIHLQWETVELADVVARAVETSRPLIESRRHSLEIFLPPEPVYLRADATRLAQVFANLLNNAAKYTETGGRITLSAATESDKVVIRVRDTGTGIAPDMLPHVFDLFAQGDRALARSEGGLGIGLTLVRDLVSLHSGSVQAQSDGMGRGSEFVVCLPRLAESEVIEPVVDAERAVERAGWERRPPPRRVVLVDDSPDVVQSLSLLLRTAGHEVYTAQDGTSAVEAALAIHPDVVLLDIGLPGIDGYEVARRIRTYPELQDVLLVAMTGYGQEDDYRRSLEAGFAAHLVKPVALHDLQSLLGVVDPSRRPPVRPTEGAGVG